MIQPFIFQQMRHHPHTRALVQLLESAVVITKSVTSAVVTYSDNSKVTSAKPLKNVIFNYSDGTSTTIS